MDLGTRYLGLELKNPIIVGASPIADDIGRAQRFADKGAAAIVMRSLFEEQIEQVQESARLRGHGHGDALPDFDASDDYARSLDGYLEQLSRLRDALDIPVIASINGTTQGGWVRYASMLEQAEADAIELNIYYVAIDPDEEPRAVEQRYIDVVQAVRDHTVLPVAVKLSPFFSAPVHTSRRLVEAGAKGLVLFNRFYQPDIDIEHGQAVPTLRLSDASDLQLRLRWLAALHGRTTASLALTGGVHSGYDVLKAVMAGADAVQMVSALLVNGPAQIERCLQELTGWMSRHGHASLSELRGCASLRNSRAPAVYERANYLRVLESWPAGVKS